MTNRPDRPDTDLQFRPLTNEEGSSVRERTPSARPASRKSDPDLSLDQRLESKLAQAAALLAKLAPRDARARLLHIAMLRRDEALLDGIVAELSLVPDPTRRLR